MKYSYLILLGLLALAPATYAEGNVNADRRSTTQTGNITVIGKIVDENGESLPGATVQQKGTSNGTITANNGNFSLSVPSDATLIVSFIGYKSIEVTVGGKTELGNITLVSDLTELDQVVVIGYGTQRKVDLTGSVAIVNAEEMKKASNSNISTMLQGKASGVQITSDGQPGADPIVRIRGIGSFGSTAPLSTLWMESQWEQPYATSHQTISKPFKSLRMPLLPQSTVRVLPTAWLSLPQSKVRRTKP